MQPRFVLFLVAPLALALSPTAAARSGDWPMFRADAARSGYTDEEIPSAPALVWQRIHEHAPAPAWPGLPRMTFDRALQPIVVEDTVFFGDTVEGKVLALAAATGEERWRYYTEGPVRFAPAAWEDRLFVASDDGFLHCLRRSDGALLWKRRGGVDGRRVLGNERLISRWPVRGGPVVVDDVVYSSAGIWPSDGIFVTARDVRTGDVRWVNDDAGSITMGQPHGGAEAESGVAAQGYLVGTDETLLVPNGRAVPASFRRADGAFEFFHLQANRAAGGTATMASGKYFFNSGLFFDAKTGAAGGSTGAAAIAGLPEGIVTGTSKGLSVFHWGEPDPAKGTRALVKERDVALAAADTALIVAGNHAVAGGRGRVSIVDLLTGERTWSAEVEGTVYGLAASGGRLFVSTDEGHLLCFGVDDGTAPRIDHRRRFWPARITTGPQSLAARAASEIRALTGGEGGYCLDVVAGDGSLALELVSGGINLPELHVIALVADAEQAARTRARIAEAGYLGSRITVHHATVEDLADYPRFFADLIVCGESVTRGADVVDRAAVAHLLRPYGGKLCLGRPGDMQCETRGALEGAGWWTHQYADAGNSVCSNDTVRGPLGMLWFRDLAHDMPQRHGRAPAPLALDGLLFSLGLDELVAVSAYNGRVLWRHPFPGILRALDGDHLMGTAGTQSPYCVTRDGVYVRDGDRCVRLDPATDEVRGTFTAPPAADGSPGVWGYLACADGILYGSLADREHIVTYRYLEGGDLAQQLTESNSLFALDAVSGERLWVYRAAHSLRHNALAVGSGQVYLIDRPMALFDRTKDEEAPDVRAPHAPGVLLCLDGRTGAERWRVEDDVFGTLLAVDAKRDALLMGYQPTRFRLESEVGGRLAVFAASTGTERWRRNAVYESRPLLNDGTVYAQGGAWDLATGDPVPFAFSRSYGCGVLAAGRNMLVYRSATLGYFELALNEKTENFGGMRPGCWINVLPAGGLVLSPDATAGCTCSYQNRAWVALAPDDLRPPTATPAGGAFSSPVEVVLAAREANTQIHYTLDGSTPTREAARFSGSLTIEESAKLKMRTFRNGASPSAIASEEFVIDPLLLPLDDAHWTVWDRGAPVNTPPSQWRVADGVVTQLSNIHAPIPAAADFARLPHYGTLRLFDDGYELADGTLSLQIRSPDNDGVGIAFRARDEAHHYLLHLDAERRLRTLARRDGERYDILASDGTPYLPGAWFDVEVRLDGPRLEVRIDGERAFLVEDDTHPRGTLALHSWGSTGVEFRRVRFAPR